jgi:hypothetical protein
MLSVTSRPFHKSGANGAQLLGFRDVAAYLQVKPGWTDENPCKSREATYLVVSITFPNKWTIRPVNRKDRPVREIFAKIHLKH